MLDRPPGKAQLLFDAGVWLVTVVQSLRAAGVAIDDIALRRPTLDDVFLTLTGSLGRDAREL